MLKRATIGLAFIIVLLGSGVTYFHVISSDYKEMIRFSDFLIPQKSILISRDDNQRVFKTREVTEKGLKISYQKALKEAGWTYIETGESGQFIYCKNGKSVEVYTGRSKLTLRDYHPYE
ncbi:MAG: hypothetical protein KBT36_12160 [Kurthia sp.]|nr:hypothetical protein [Candidatus Kurthia equi]